MRDSYSVVTEVEFYCGINLKIFTQLLLVNNDIFDYEVDLTFYEREEDEIEKCLEGEGQFFLNQKNR